MSDEELAPPPMLDLEAARLRRKKSACSHDSVEVDEVLASLTCTTCGAEVDPWGYLRRVARDHQDVLVERQQVVDRFYEWQKHARAQIDRLQAEISNLIEIKNRLENEEVMGVRLGQHARRKRSPRPT